jgi:hypothetical protein
MYNIKIMEKIKFLRKHLLIVLFIFILGACTNDNKTEFEVHGDAVFIKKIINSEPVVGTAYYAYSNKILSACTVTPPSSDQNINLAAYQINTLLFAYEPSDNEFTSTSTSLIEGNYLFNATSSDNETIEVSDEQSFSDLGFAQLDERTFDTNNHWLYLTWGVVTGADSYTVSLINSSNETIFSGYAVKADSPEFYISTLLDYGVWAKQPTYNDTYTLRIKCFKYDTDATADDYTYSVQEISQKDYSIVWKLN